MDDIYNLKRIISNEYDENEGEIKYSSCDPNQYDKNQLYPSSDDIGTDCIHQIWMQGVDHLKANRRHFYDNLMEFKAIHKNKHVTWSEDMIKSLIINEYPHLLTTYNSYQHFIMRVDLAKYIILHYYGGFYCDMDSKCKQNFQALKYMTHNNKVLLCQIVDDKRTKVYKRKFINNHFFYVPIRKHPFMSLMLNEIPKCAKRRKLEPMILFILRAVGPGFLMNCIKKYKKQIQKQEKKYNKKHGIKNKWPICGGLQSEDVVSIIRSDILNNYFVHESSNTWLEKEWLDDKDKHNAVIIGGSTAAALGVACIVILLLSL